MYVQCTPKIRRVTSFTLVLCRQAWLGGRACDSCSTPGGPTVIGRPRLSDQRHPEPAAARRRLRPPPSSLAPALRRRPCRAPSAGPRCRRTWSWRSVPSPSGWRPALRPRRRPARRPPAAKRPPSAAERTVPGSSDSSSAPQRTVLSSPSLAGSERSAGLAARSVVLPPRAEVLRTREKSSPDGSPRQEAVRRVTVPAGGGTELMAQAGNIAQFRCRVPVTQSSGQSVGPLSPPKTARLYQR